MAQWQLKLNQEQCVGCGLCAKVCVAHNLKIVQNKAQTVLKKCIGCGQCVAVCPKRAIAVTGNVSTPVEKKEPLRLNPQEVLDVIRYRRTIRNFKQQEIPQDELAQILEAGRLTHTAENLQDVSFIVLDKEKSQFEQLAVQLFRKIKPLANLVSPLARNNEIDDNFFFFKAPIVIVILAKDKMNGVLAAQNMEFVAEAHGLGVLYSGYFTMAANVSRKIKEALHVPKGKRVAMTLILGYPAVDYLRSAPRKNLEVTYR